MTDRKNGFVLIRGTDKSRRETGPCLHFKVTAKDMLGSTSYNFQGGTIVMTNHALQLLGLLRPYDSVLNESGFHGWIDLTHSFQSTAAYKNLCLEAFMKQSAQVPNKTSAINFAIELAELKPIFKNLGKIPKLIREDKLVQQIGKPALIKRKLPKKVAKAGVDTFLGWNFGWAPFIGDLRTFVTTMDDVAKRINYLLKTRGKETVVRFSKKEAYTHPNLGQVVYTRDDSNDVYQRIVLRNYECKFVSTWRLFHNLEGLDDAWAGLRAAFAHLGVNNPLKIVWNAIPFSFLVDWVYPVSTWLEKAAIQPFFGQWDVYDVNSSVHEVFVYDFLFTGKHGGTNGTEFTVVVDRYSRLNGLPFTLGAFDLSQLTDTQQKLAFSIPLSRILK
jgi:hypothetical protein